MPVSKNIVLIGMPGAGKTTLGKMLAQQIGFQFIDIDDVIEDEFGTIISLFLKGEAHFRKIEAQATKIVAKRKKTVIATGGGIVLSEDSMELLSTDGIIVFIDRPITSIIQDINSSSRPLLAEGKERLAELFAQRYQLYKEYADIIVDNDAHADKVIEDIIQEVKELLQ